MRQKRSCEASRCVGRIESEGRWAERNERRERRSSRIEARRADGIAYREGTSVYRERACVSPYASQTRLPSSFALVTHTRNVKDVLYATPSSGSADSGVKSTWRIGLSTAPSARLPALTVRETVSLKGVSWS